MRKVVRLLLAVFILLLATSGVARAQSTEIRAKIAAVRIVVVDRQQHIIEVYSNTDQELLPEVRQDHAAGSRLRITDSIKRQYQTISATIPHGATGQVYKQVALPSLLQILYAGDKHRIIQT